MKKIGIVMGSDSDLPIVQKAIDTLNKVYTDCNGNVHEMMKKLMEIAALEENGVEHDEVVRICGKEIILSYSKRKAYNTYGRELANCADLPKIPKEAIKAVLMARVEAILK